MGDRDRAAELLHQALGVDPTHEEALARYVDHFRERRDWRGLIDLYEFALDNARDAGADADDWSAGSRRSPSSPSCGSATSDRAIEAWQRIAELEPGERQGHRGAAPADRALARCGSSSSRASRPRSPHAGDPITRIAVLKKMAQTYRERQIEPRRAIELYEQVLAGEPG